MHSATKLLSTLLRSNIVRAWLRQLSSCDHHWMGSHSLGVRSFHVSHISCTG